MMITQKELDAAAEAAIKVFTDAGYGWAVNMERARGLAAPMIRAYLNVHNLSSAVQPAALVDDHHVVHLLNAVAKGNAAT